MKKGCLLIILCLLSSATFLHASPATEKSVREFLAVTGAGKMVEQSVQTIIPSLKPLCPDAPDAFWVSFAKDVNTNDLINALIPVYQKHFTEEDLKAVTAFYNSPAGKRMVKETPSVMMDSMKVSQEWGRSVADLAVKKSQQYQKQNKKK